MHADDADSVAVLSDIVRRLADVNHVAPVAEIQARASEQGLPDCDDDFVRAFLDRTETTVWLDRTHNWFWDGRETRYINYATKVLALNERVGLETLRAGVLRHHRTRQMSLPREAFAGLCRAAGFRVEDGFVSLSERVPADDLLGEIERTLAEILRSSDCVMHLHDLREQAVSRGMNRHSFWVYLS